MNDLERLLRDALSGDLDAHKELRRQEDRTGGHHHSLELYKKNPALFIQHEASYSGVVLPGADSIEHIARDWGPEYEAFPKDPVRQVFYYMGMQALRLLPMDHSVPEGLSRSLIAAQWGSPLLHSGVLSLSVDAGLRGYAGGLLFARFLGVALHQLYAVWIPAFDLHTSNEDTTPEQHHQLQTVALQMAGSSWGSAYSLAIDLKTQALRMSTPE